MCQPKQQLHGGGHRPVSMQPPCKLWHGRQEHRVSSAMSMQMLPVCHPKAVTTVTTTGAHHNSPKRLRKTAPPSSFAVCAAKSTFFSRNLVSSSWFRPGSCTRTLWMRFPSSGDAHSTIAIVPFSYRSTCRNSRECGSTPLAQVLTIPYQNTKLSLATGTKVRKPVSCNV